MQGMHGSHMLGSMDSTHRFLCFLLELHRPLLHNFFGSLDNLASNLKKKLGVPVPIL